MTGLTKLTVRYSETDQMGIVHHSRYYPWFEVGRTEFFRSLGFSYKEMEQKGVLFPLTQTHCNYISGAKYEDEIIVETTISSLSYARCTFTYNILRDKKLIATGYTMHGFVNADFKPINLKKYDASLWDILNNAMEEK